MRKVMVTRWLSSSYRFTTSQNVDMKPAQFVRSLLGYVSIACMAIVPLAAALEPTENSPAPGCDAQGKPIKAVEINLQPVFDESNPAENNWLFRQINHFHVGTKPSIVKNDLIFKEGDLLDQKIIDESARKLRYRPYLNDARIEVVDLCSPTPSVKVEAHEVWTLVPELSYSHSGGKSSYGFGLHDSNFLGYGKTVTFGRTSSPERSGNLFEYYDPNTGFYNSIFSFYFADNSDGRHTSSSLIKPFEALHTNWSAGLVHEDYTQENTLYNAGKEADRFAHENSNQSFFYGARLPAFSTHEYAQRLVVGIDRWQDDFSPITTPTPSTYVPASRQFDFPWLEYQYVEDGYIQTRNIQQINRIEDINLGAQVRFRLGYTSSKYAFFDQNLVFASDYSQAFLLSDTQMLITDFSAKGLHNSTGYINSVFSNTTSYHWKNFERGQFYVGITRARGSRLFGERPLELGGDTGLRGYPARYQSGDELQLVTLEQRFFGEREWFALFHVGAAVFYDEGRVWGNSPIPQAQTGRLRDFGVGLRFSGTRNGSRDAGWHNVLHLDIASPLDGDKDISKVQWIVRVKQGF